MRGKGQKRRQRVWVDGRGQGRECRLPYLHYLLAPTPPDNTSQIGWVRETTTQNQSKNKAKQNPPNPPHKPWKVHRILWGLCVLRMTWILVSIQVRKSPITHNSLHKIPWQLPVQIFWSFPVSEKQYYKCNSCQSWKPASRLCQVRSGNPRISEWGVDGRVGGKCERKELEIYKLLSQED